MLFLIILFLIILLIILLYPTVRLKNINLIVVFLCTCIIIYFISFPKQCINSTIYGAKIFFNAVFPSLFSFLIICNLLIKYDGIIIYSKLFGKILCKPLRLPMQCSLAVIISTLCGYPLGAKYCCDIYEKKLISQEECQRLLNIASNTSPLFIVGSVATVMLGNTQLGYLMLISNYVSCVVMSFILKPTSTYRLNTNGGLNIVNSTSRKNFGGELKESIENALKSTLSIGGYIVFFAVLIDIVSYNKFLDSTLMYLVKNSETKNTIKYFFLGMIELTKGCKLISTLDISLYSKSLMISFLAAFSGLSIISQVYSFTYKYPELSMKVYIKRKAVQGIISSLVTALMLIPFEKLAVSTFNGMNSVFSYTWVYMLIFILFIIPILFSVMKRLFHVS